MRAKHVDDAFVYVVSARSKQSVMFSICVIIITQPLFKMCNVIDRQVLGHFYKKKKRHPWRIAVTNKCLFIIDY